MVRLRIRRWFMFGLVGLVVGLLSATAMAQPGGGPGGGGECTLQEALAARAQAMAARAEAISGLPDGNKAVIYDDPGLWDLVMLSSLVPQADKLRMIAIEATAQAYEDAASALMAEGDDLIDEGDDLCVAEAPNNPDFCAAIQKFNAAKAKFEAAGIQWGNAAQEWAYLQNELYQLYVQYVE